MTYKESVYQQNKIEEIIECSIKPIAKTVIYIQIAYEESSSSIYIFYSGHFFNICY